MHALSGNAPSNTIRIQGKVNGQVITILIDSGSTNSFIDPHTVSRCGVDIHTWVMVVAMADGNQLTSDATCKGFKWSMQGVKFQADIRVLALGGCDMVLGTDWMKQFSPLLFDF